ncbi:undecaprenyldiphospho-muramoylpentapeptide beta-N-acetylglucosaminyltransferase [Legionella dresdenensis]|uniref:UDP-N-acetylglucosamine--N-acetylmuramyl-(pentapeptide) pyrophosphoryl-undecaprenol N-acetylglucosamine transferase n=1 Tax=Legionella dresdenensis TaxID=450200 RepID=A0ABV8CHY1_9GAMM
MTMKIVFTGGGTAGHVTPNFALIDAVQAEGWQVDYIGSLASVEQDLVTRAKIPFHAIQSGKLRRYFSWKTFIEPFKIATGICQAFFLLRKLQTDVVFSKGGFVAFPVVFAAWLNRIPVIAHESDMTPGLANKLSFPFVDHICLGFEPAQSHFKNKEKITVTGTPIRAQLFKGSKQRGLEFCGFTQEKPCLLIMGGSQGAANLNRAVRQAAPNLLERYQIIHLCGKGKLDNSMNGQKDYYQLEYANEQLPDLLAASDIIISRAGANAVCEILALQKPHVLVPISAKASRGDQIQNARYFQKQGVSVVVADDELSSERLCAAVDDVENRKGEIISIMKALDSQQSAIEKIVVTIKEQLHAESPKAV